MDFEREAGCPGSLEIPSRILDAEHPIFTEDIDKVRSYSLLHAAGHPPRE
jgi:hypothetical protein